MKLSILSLFVSVCAFAQFDYATNILPLNIQALHGQANLDNAAAVAAFTRLQANAAMAGSKTVVPGTIVYETVDDGYATALLNSKQQAFATGQPSEVFVNGFDVLNPYNAIAKTSVVVPPGSTVSLTGTFPYQTLVVTPPVTPVVIPPNTTIPTDLIGNTIGSGIYNCVPNDNSPDGTKASDSKGSFVKHIAQTPFTTACWWTVAQ